MFSGTGGRNKNSEKLELCTGTGLAAVDALDADDRAVPWAAMVFPRSLSAVPEFSGADADRGLGLIDLWSTCSENRRVFFGLGFVASLVRSDDGSECLLPLESGFKFTGTSVAA